MIKSLPQLRAEIARLEGFAPPGTARVCALGWPAIDAALPGGGLLCGALHEIMSPDPGDGTALGFALHILGRFLRVDRERPALWVGSRADLHGPGLLVAGLDPGRLLVALCPSSGDLLFAIEEGLNAGTLCGVVGEIGDLDFTLTRRLHLAAAAQDIPLLLLRPLRCYAQASAAVTRWQAAALPGGGWMLDLLRCRGGRPGRWRIEAIAC